MTLQSLLHSGVQPGLGPRNISCLALENKIQALGYGKAMSKSRLKAPRTTCSSAAPNPGIQEACCEVVWDGLTQEDSQ
jgi:hypothetical protein